MNAEHVISRLARMLAALAALGFLALGGTAAQAATVTFYCITTIADDDDAPANCAIGEAQMQVEIVDAGGGQVGFILTNLGPADSAVTDVYFDDGSLLGIASVVNSPGVDFSVMASPGNLPGANNALPPFVTSTGFFSTDSNPPVSHNGIDPIETLMILFDLQGGGTYAQVLDELRNGELRIGLHVQAFENGGSISLVSNPLPVPLPAALWMFTSALAAFGLRMRRLAFAG